MKMKKILLIGDSIRQGYDKYVKAALKDSFEVVYPSENCMFAQYIYRSLHNWKEALNLGDEVELIHWNAGLWDTLELIGEEGSDGELTPPEIYAFYIERICKRIKFLFPKARVIFATSTPVQEELFNKTVAIRRNETTRRYNEIAVKIAKSYGFFIDDLYSVVENAPKTYYSDLTHLYTPEGTCLLTNAVIKSICSVTGTDFTEFSIANFEEVKEILGI